MEPYRSVPDKHASPMGGGNANYAGSHEAYSTAPEVNYGQYADFPQVHQGYTPQAAGYDYSQKEALHQHPSEIYPEAVAAPMGSPAPPGYYAAELGHSHAAQGQAGAEFGAGAGAASQRTICGIRRRNLFILLGVVALVVIGAVVGGVVGGLKSRGASSSGSSGDDGAIPKPGPTNMSGPGVLSGTKIAASNWTGFDGFQRRAVFFQDDYSSVIARLWDSQNSTWMTHNVSDILRSRKLDLKMAPAKTLASAALDTVNVFGPRLWYVDTNNVIQTLLNPNLDVKSTPDGWQIAEPSTFNHQIWPDSQIAGCWQRCFGNCVGDWIVAYQRASDGSIMTANNSHWNDPDQALDSSSVSKSTALGIIPWYGAVINKLGLISENGKDVQLDSYDGFNGSWTGAVNPIIQGVIPSSSSETQFATTSWNHWHQTLFMSLTSDNIISGSLQAADGTRTTAQLSFTGYSGLTKDNPITAMSTSLDAMFYGVTKDGKVLEYKLDTGHPGTWLFSGVVWPPPPP